MVSVGLLDGPQIGAQIPDAEGDGNDTAQAFSLWKPWGLCRTGRDT